MCMKSQLVEEESILPLKQRKENAFAENMDNVESSIALKTLFLARIEKAHNCLKLAQNTFYYCIYIRKTI